MNKENKCRYVQLYIYIYLFPINTGISDIFINGLQLAFKG